MAVELQQAPEQQQLLPGQQRPWNWTGIDMAKWEKEAAPPPSYDPPQLRPGYMWTWKTCLCVNWWGQRSPCLVSPCFPCCCACCLRKCLVPSAEVVRFDQPDAWMLKMLNVPASPNCPEYMKGIYWLQDNIAPHEHLVTFHDADWKDDKRAQKIYHYNWTTGSTAFGTGGLIGAKYLGVILKIHISPDNKWINMGGDEPGGLIYRLGPEDKFTCPDGSELPYEEGLMMRISVKNEGKDQNPKIEDGNVAYQYRVRRIAHLDDSGRLVKLPAYEELLKLAEMPLKYNPCCCDYFWCGLTEETAALKNFPMMPSETTIIYAPPPPGAI